MLLPFFGILFDSLLSAAKSHVWFKSSTSLVSSSYSCLCCGFLHYSYLLVNLHLHLPLKRLSAIVKISILLISHQSFSLAWFLSVDLDQFHFLLLPWFLSSCSPQFTDRKATWTVLDRIRPYYYMGKVFFPYTNVSSSLCFIFAQTPMQEEVVWV